ncbi:FtsK/SpoIIIE-like protein [Bacillus phage Moonbeam]|uniref:FtsK/SpoIIIE protein n=1 Tax=Bacillus phage Moonbeam TaxID=1540091 RepID=A0A0A0RSS2_9CAUD|nr:FtsK/SpoIIIE-like protein [Bacillus phage Moonbeam]AIW03586.1 FtsK/SpoIIIE protein [Bacillus phage Moonbeam]
MKKLSANYHNLANLFMPVEDIEGHFVDILEQINDSVFGVETHLTGEGANTFVIAPSHIETGAELVLRHREAPTEGFNFFEGYLSEAFFLPLRQDKNGLFLTDLLDLALHPDEEVHAQWLLRRRYGWQDRAIDMYDSYIQGNEKPSWSRWSRKLQDKAVRVLNKIQPEDYKPYEPLAEEKIKSECFQFQLRIAVKSERVNDIIQYIQYALGSYTALNELKLVKSSDKQFITNYTDCVLAAYTKDQLLSLNEVFSLLGGTVEKTEKVLEEVVERKAYPFDLLPMYKREQGTLDEGIVSKLAEGMKRVKLIDTARLYNERIDCGVRLGVVQVSIPKDVTFSKIEKSINDLRAATGISGLGVENGDIADTVKFTVPLAASPVISLRELVETEEFISMVEEKELMFVAGVDTLGEPIYLSLTECVHLLVAGTTGSGKSVFVNVIIVSMMLMYPPEKLQFIMIDPAMVELSKYEDSPHVLDVVTDAKEACQVLAGLTMEMDKRYALMKEKGTKLLSLYNEVAEEPLPYLVCIVDEYADLRAVDKGVEDYIARLGQKARKTGIHLVVATQYPSADIVSGRIKANLPTAISFRLNKNKDYTTIFGVGLGTTVLDGKGDGVIRLASGGDFIRFQSPMVSVDEKREQQVCRDIFTFYQGSRIVDYKIAVADKPLEPVQDVLEEEKVNTPEECKETPKQALEALEAMFSSTEDDPLYKLKKIVANTGETRSNPLRKELGIGRDKMKPLMTQLVEEGWLEKDNDPTKGYKLVATEDMLAEWKD